MAQLGDSQRELWNLLIEALFNTATLHPNPAVQEVYQMSLSVTYLLLVLAIAYVGLLYIGREPLSLDTRTVLPRLLIAVIFGFIALPMLQYGVDFSDALVKAFQPTDPATIGEYLGISAGGLLAILINYLLLLALVVVFILRNVYLLFVASISPLLALAWALPNTNRYAQSFISGWFAVLAMVPLDALALRFILAMTEGSAGFSITGASNWVLGVAAFTLLLWIPLQLYRTSQAIVGQGFRLTRGLSQGVTRLRNKGSSGQNQRDQSQNSRNRRRRGPR
ncbi:hypothetical protein C454_11131 [Haloferax gibbonsii ATCC 33959]|uniref:Uncharacterized protein n=1 Tax=Haloferax gibbonsii (strain ATCC 33959 / DSM 4427 / JCM 8863 / NBRC 102184 / NCIMB 2188 / Ma 2.38) TaxID=1227459 RepID=M0H8U9_HALGM|nr:hypothetical protein C454_11131 [Haloferax gibbonsii ATCC 33959]